MTKNEEKALKDYFAQINKYGQKPSPETAMHFILGACGYIEGFIHEYEKEMKK